MSIQVGDCFKFLWPFQNVRTLLSFHKSILVQQVDVTSLTETLKKNNVNKTLDTVVIR